MNLCFAASIVRLLQRLAIFGRYLNLHSCHILSDICYARNDNDILKILKVIEFEYNESDGGDSFVFYDHLVRYIIRNCTDTVLMRQICSFKEGVCLPLVGVFALDDIHQKIQYLISMSFEIPQFLFILHDFDDIDAAKDEILPLSIFLGGIYFELNSMSCFGKVRDVISSVEEMHYYNKYMEGGNTETDGVSGEQLVVKECPRILVYKTYKFEA